MPARSDIDRLIELGLNRYGAGDLDGALLMWEEALAIDPAHAQANSYVDYVRENYGLLSSAEPELADDGSYALQEEPEYQIEIVPGELPPGEVAPMYMDPLDAGWFIEEATHDAGLPVAAPSASDPGEHEHMTLELEADEPPPPDFDDATQEYHGLPIELPARPKRHPSDFSTEPATTEFQHEESTGGFSGSQFTPLGFSHQETEIKKRDFGFVQAPTRELEPGDGSPLAIGTAPTVEVSSMLEQPDEELRAPRTTTPTTPPVKGKSTTRDLPPLQRTPARRDSEALSQAEVMLPHTPTQDFGERARVDVAAPTRELGLRPGGRPPTLGDEDEPTKQTDARAIRAAAARGDGEAGALPSDGTKHDIVLPFDPIDARSAQILDEVDAEVPPGEGKDDQTRRRITLLLQRAADYSADQDLDKAVAACDLALSEDPNSAVGQKLIARHRDTIMTVFQNFIGDLERMPQLAKPLHELSSAPISPRAAFLLSRIDGTLTIDELLDVSGMPKLEAFRHLCQLFLRGILR